MGFMVEGSTGARAVAMLKQLPQGTVIETPEFAAALGVNPNAIHQLLVNAVKLRLIKKMRRRGTPCIGWALGAGNVGVTIEQRPPKVAPTAEEFERRVAAAERRAARQAERDAVSPKLPKPPAWPPGFVSAFDLHAANARAFADMERDFVGGAAVDIAAAVPAWLVGTGLKGKGGRRRQASHGERCPASYLARWLVHYAGEGHQLHSVIRVQSIDPRGGRIKAWCEQQQEMRTFRWSGIRRAEDADRGTRVDLGAWWCNARSKLGGATRAGFLPLSDDAGTPAVDDQSQSDHASGVRC